MSLEMISKENLIRAISHPHLFIKGMKRVYENNMLIPILNRSFISEHGPGIDVTKKDWDNLIILDALRYDILKEVSMFDNQVSSVISQASTSVDFVKRNFENKQLNDTVYVTANGWIEKLESDPFFVTKKTYGSFEQRYQHYDPENVYNLALDTYDKFQNKKYIIHFMQPHIPYLGTKSSQLRQRVSKEEQVTFRGAELVSGEKTQYDDQNECLLSLLSAARKGYISDRELKEVYIENIEIVLPYVRKLSKALDGKTVITADHGELLGENIGPFSTKWYGHPANVTTTELRQVPWLELDFDKRRNINRDEAIESDTATENDVKESLKALGYY